MAERLEKSAAFVSAVEVGKKSPPSGFEEAVIKAPGGFSVLLAGSGMVEYSRLTPEVRADMGVTEGMVRINVGLEDPQDLIDDLDQALTTVGL